MKESMVVNIAYHANDPNAGMALHHSTDNVIYHKLLSDKLAADLGYVYENIVSQMLKAAGNELYYYIFPTESGKHNYEIDFMIADGDKISPVEVKSSEYKAHASLDAFANKFSSRIRYRYLIYTKDLRKETDIVCLPVYMTIFFEITQIWRCKNRELPKSRNTISCPRAPLWHEA